MDWLLHTLNGLHIRMQTSKASSSQSAPQQILSQALEKINDNVYEVCKPVGRPSVEIIFFHGLQLEYPSSKDAHITTWVSRDKTQFWLNWLLQDFPNAHILTISYDAFPRRTEEQGLQEMYITRENLLHSLIGDEVQVGQDGCPVVLVGHCLGGLVMKELCVQANSILSLNRQDKSDERVENFLQNMTGLFTYATPHHGLRLADRNTYLQKGPLFEDLKTLNADTARRNEEFRKVREKFETWKTYGVGETHPSKVGSFTGILVPEASARHNMDSFSTIAADHFDICRPVSRQCNSYQLLSNFVADVLKKDEARYSTKNGLLTGQDIVGLQANVDILVEKLRQTQRLGIVGIPGIGKTTLAKAIFDKISGKFEYTCFLSEVKNVMADEENSDHLRDKIVEKLKHRGADVNISFRWSKLKGKKVLIILDDAEFESQVTVMIKSDGFSKDSRVIVTSRNSGFLRPQDFEIHNAKALSNDDSEKLLCLHAFKRPRAPRSHKEHVIKLVEKCGGLPLALKVSGSYLYNRNAAMWDDALKKLSRAQSLNGSRKDGLWSILSWSYDSLAPSEQEMFLDVATCFRYVELKEVQKAWRTCSWASTAAESGCQNLLDRCLVSQNEWGYFSMHEMLRDLGRDRGSHSRMLLSVSGGIQEANQLLRKEEKATLKVLIIYDGYYYYINDHLVDKDGLELYGLEKLEILWLSKVPMLSISPGELPALRQLKIYKCRLLVGLGQLQTLEGLQINYCDFIELSESIRELRALRSLEIIFCASLKALPNTLGRLHNLEHLTILTCGSLTELPQSVGRLMALRHLEIGECNYLNALPETLGQLQALEQLIIKSCKRLTMLPESIGHLRALRHLEITECNSLIALPNDLGELQALEQLIIKACEILTVLPESIGHLRALQHLEIRDCKSLKALPNKLRELQALEQFIISLDLRVLPGSIDQLGALQHLEIDMCTSLIALPSSLGELQALEMLKLKGCYELRVLPESIGQLRALRHLEIDMCTSLIALPNNLGALQTLEHLKIDHCINLRVLPESIGQLHALRHLHIQDCFALNALPKTLGQLQALEQLTISHCFSLTVLPESVGRLGALQHLEIVECWDLNALPNTLRQLHALDQVTIAKKDVDHYIGALPRSARLVCPY